MAGVRERAGPISGLALGLWLLVSAFAWPHGDAQQTNHLICGALAAALGALGLVSAGVLPIVRRLQAIVALWLIVSVWLLPTSLGTASSLTLTALGLWLGGIGGGPRDVGRRPRPPSPPPRRPDGGGGGPEGDGEDEHPHEPEPRPVFHPPDAPHADPRGWGRSAPPPDSHRWLGRLRLESARKEPWFACAGRWTSPALIEEPRRQSSPSR